MVGKLAEGRGKRERVLEAKGNQESEKASGISVPFTRTREELTEAVQQRLSATRDNLPSVCPLYRVPEWLKVLPKMKMMMSSGGSGTQLNLQLYLPAGISCCCYC